MIGFLDLEFNSDSDFKSERTDYSIVEIAFVIVEDIESFKSIESYHTYCKPCMNDGKIRDRVTRITGITQEQIDSGVTLDTAISDIDCILERYEVSEIYTWSDAENHVFQFNKKFVSEENKKRVKAIISKLKDGQLYFEKKIGIKDNISLQNALILCGMDKRVRHSSLSDCEDMQMVLIHSIKHDVPKANIFKYTEYVELRNKYYAIRQTFRYFAQNGIDNDEVIQFIIDRDLGFNFEKYLKEYDTQKLNILKAKFTNVFNDSLLLNITHKMDLKKFLERIKDNNDVCSFRDYCIDESNFFKMDNN